MKQDHEWEPKNKFQSLIWFTQASWSYLEGDRKLFFFGFRDAWKEFIRNHPKNIGWFEKY